MKQQNPYAYLRTRGGMTQREFADYAEMARSTLVYIEAGLYPDISDRQNQVLAQLCHERGIEAAVELDEHYGEKSLNDAYHSWQSVQRQQNAEAFTKVEPRWSARGAFTVYVHDVAGTVDRFCKMLKVPPMTVKRYMTGETLTMPHAVRDALAEVRYPWLNRLAEYHDKWVELAHEKDARLS